jgi:hypothetical protein
MVRVIDIAKRPANQLRSISRHRWAAGYIENESRGVLMITDLVPRAKVKKQEYMQSDGLATLLLPPAHIMHAHARELEAVMSEEDKKGTEQVCNVIAAEVSKAFEVKSPTVSILGVRPHRTDDGVCIYQKFGDYDLETSRIRLWMRTAMQKKVTSYGALLNTLCHELCHHLDVVTLGFPNTPHTRGFFERTAILYHHIKDTPRKPLVWIKQNDGTYRFDWAKIMSGRRTG